MERVFCVNRTEVNKKLQSRALRFATSRESRRKVVPSERSASIRRFAFFLSFVRSLALVFTLARIASHTCTHLEN